MKNQIDEQGRQCRVCKDYKTWDNFYKNKRGTRGYSGMCKQCDNSSVSVSRKSNPGRYKKNYDNYRKRDPERWRRHMRSWLLRSKYGITLEDYNKLLSRQKNKCAICNRPDSGRKRDKGSFLVDHDHKTGKVRGLLCYQCNVGIGLLGDTAEKIQKVTMYLGNSLLYNRL